MQSRLLHIAAIAVTLTIVAAPASAQRGRGIPVKPLRDVMEYPTGEGMNIRIVVETRGLENPWSLAFLPDGSMLITERPGRLRLYRNGELSDPIPGLPDDIEANNISGLFDVKLHPDFARNRLVYLTYNKGREGGRPVTAMVRGVFDGKALTNVEDVFIAEGATSVSRMLFGPDGSLYMSTYGERDEIAQDPMNYAGKILRMNDDGKGVPSDNPFVGRAGHHPEIYTVGHRTPESLVWHEPTGQIYETEMGPNGGDEVNVIVAGGNYGWPYVSLGRTYAGPHQPDKFHREGMIDPVVSWVPSISTTGAAFYTGDRLAAWQGDLFVGGVRYGEIAGTGQLSRIVFNDNMEEIRRESLLTDLGHRIRFVAQGPDELLYVLTDMPDGALLRIEPAD